MSIETYDLAIIGSGSGNSLITPYWDDKRVAIIESGVFGGTCLNRGCIPTKMFAYPSMLAASPEQAQRVNVGLEFRRADWPGMRDRIFSRIDAISEGGRAYRDVELESTTLIAEETRFSGRRQLTTETGRVIEAENIVIAAGSRATVPEVPGINLPQVHTSDTVMRIDTLPRRMVIVGGGYIAAEFAAIFAGLGTEVIQVNRSHRLLRQHDETISDVYTKMAAQQWTVRTGAVLERIDQASNGVDVVFKDASGSEERGGFIEQADVVLVALGRVPNTDRLDPHAAGLDTHPDGRLVTDEYLRLLSGGEPVEGLWAIGDITNPWQLKHVANHQQRVVSHNIENPSDLRSAELHPVPAAVFTRPQIASAGLTQAQAVKQYGADALTIKIQKMGDVAYGWAMEDERGLVKLIAEKSTGQILGAHLIGEDSSNLIQPLIQAMAFGIDAHRMARGQYWIHPALAEVVENALLGLEVPDSGKL